MELIDPTSELAPETRQPLPRLVASSTDVTIGLLDISKPKGDVFLNRVEDLLQQRGIKTRRRSNCTYFPFGGHGRTCADRGYSSAQVFSKRKL